ncbi:hypothetical protein BCT63_20710 [Vibrio kanaloae]|nr:hypothetical protein BCT63_20710 [Vibrio kanaloae]
MLYEGSVLNTLELVKKLHVYFGLIFGPFIFIAALTGALYIISPQVESFIYKNALTGSLEGSPQSLQMQVQTARASLDSPLKLIAVRPSPEIGTTTRVLFSDPQYSSQLTTVFVDPSTLEVKATLPTYGTSGALPLMTTLDFLHRSLLMGDGVRFYSELAASWMSLLAISGIFLIFRSRTKIRNYFKFSKKNHQSIGLLLFVFMLFFSATGLTWSQWAGGNINDLRKDIGWTSPSLNLELPRAISGQKNTENDFLFDPMLELAREHGLESRKIELRVPQTSNYAWEVREIDRSWPTQVDRIAVDPSTMAVVSGSYFENYTVIAKLIRWGIDAHMGVLFGLPNQIVLFVFGLLLCTTIFLGYFSWWKKKSKLVNIFDLLSKVSNFKKLLFTALFFSFGVFLPILGLSFLVVIIIDYFKWKTL